MKKYAGFTLIELMVTVVLIGILLAVGMPSLKSLTQGNLVVEASNELVSAMHMARSEAIKLNSRVSICESSNGTSCSATGDWRNGWIVFIDAAGNGDLNNTGAPCENNVATDCLLRVHEGFTENDMTITGLDQDNLAATAFTFSSIGLPKDALGVLQSGVFAVCSFDADDNIVHSRAVILNFSGRVRISDNDNVIACVVPS